MQKLIERFVEKFVPVTESGCWLWTGASTPGGYGVFYANGRQGVAHRYSYEKIIGPVPSGMELDHLCRVRCCVNPSHLEPVTRKENLRRGSQRHQWTVKKAATLTHCPNGHPYDSTNTRIAVTATGNERRCRACERAACARWYARKRRA